VWSISPSFLYFESKNLYNTNPDSRVEDRDAILYSGSKAMPSGNANRKAVFLSIQPSTAKAYDCVIIGGGIHGVGTLHDLATRGTTKTLLIEKNTIGSGTSSKSTKLIHGGLRYLQNPWDIPLVYEGLQERALLLKLAPELCSPLEFLFPVFKGAGMPAWMVKIGLTMYDLLAGSKNIHKHRGIHLDEAKAMVPGLQTSSMRKIFSFWDGQTDDLALTRLVAKSAEALGAKIQTKTAAVKLVKQVDHWAITTNTGDKIKAKTVVNAAGPWADNLLGSAGLTPIYQGVNIRGSHLLLEDLGLKAGVFLQSPPKPGRPNRILFLLPWLGKTMIGTTEAPQTSPDECAISEEECAYMIECINYYMNRSFSIDDVEQKFAGMRWLARQPGKSMNKTSRKHKITIHTENECPLLTIYGGKLTAYRALCEEVSNKVAKALGNSNPSGTKQEKNWVSAETEIPLADRFDRLRSGEL